MITDRIALHSALIPLLIMIIIMMMIIILIRSIIMIILVIIIMILGRNLSDSFCITMRDRTTDQPLLKPNAY